MTLPDINFAAMGIMGYLVILLCVVVSIMWLLLPVWVIIIKSRMDDMVNLQEELVSIMRKDK